MSITITQAVNELTYRALPRPRPARDFDAGEAFQASRDQLKAIAAKSKAKKSPAAKQTAMAKKVSQAIKAQRVVDPHTALRQQAWAFRVAERQAGRKVSYADACAKFGTTPAKASA